MNTPTPGQWLRRYGRHGNSPIEIHAGGVVIARVLAGPGIGEDGAKANARLVVCAPELLTRCEALVAVIRGFAVFEPKLAEAVAMAEEAIQKAMGE